MNPVYVIFLSAVVFVGTNSISQAQIQESDEQLGKRTSLIRIDWRQGFPRYLVEQNDVQADLGLQSKEIEMLIEIFARIDKEVEAERVRKKPDVSRLNFEARQVRYYDFERRLNLYKQELLVQHVGQIKTILSDQQLDRLQQIILQKADLSQIVRDRNVVAELGITSAQEQCINGFIGKWAKVRSLYAQGRVGLEEYKSAVKECDEGIMGGLTIEQAESLKALRGRPFVSSQK